MKIAAHLYAGEIAIPSEVVDEVLRTGETEVKASFVLSIIL